MAHALLLLAILPCVLSTATIPANRLFQNTLRRWEITILNDKDRSERWNRFIKAKESVDRTTSGVILESLNRFTVLNDIEYEARVGPMRRQHFNSTYSNLLMGDIIPRARDRRKRQYVDVEIPDTFTYWEDDVGLITPIDQFGCGSCWSFPTVGAMEALYKEKTGELISLSQQYFIDCTFDGDGCGGGEIDDGYDITMMRQFVPSYASGPYQAYYQTCQFDDEIESGENNGLAKLWLTDKVGLSTNENAFLNGLQTSPVAFGSYVSSSIYDYSGGVWTDSSCSSDPNAHAMLLVGYTETILRVKASYGSDWGDSGYINYERGTVTLDSCNFYKDAYAITMTYRREIEYAWCNDQRLATRAECKQSCDDMDTETETGWTLAIIPTKMHNDYLVQLAEGEYPGVRDNDKFNLYWMGLKDPDQDTVYEWIDGSEVLYTNSTPSVNKYGMLDKNTGYWEFKGSNTWESRGFCSRTVTCWDVGTAVEDGEVTFDRDTLTEGTVATAACDDGYTLVGNETFTCVGGDWDKDLPICESGETEELLPCDKPTIDNGSVEPDTDTIDSSSSYTVTCGDGYEVSGSASVTCTNGTLSALPTCEEVAIVCSIPTIANAVLDPTTDTIDPGSNYTVTCDDTYVMSGSSVVSCQDDGTLTDLPSCSEASKCAVPTIADGTVSPTTTISDGETYSVTCNEWFEISGGATVTCTLSDSVASLSDLPTCEETPSCYMPDIGNGTSLPEVERIGDGEDFTISCFDDYYLEGEENMTCTVTNGTGTLSEAPSCLPVPMCVMPDIGNGTSLPEVWSIGDGESFTISCFTNFYLEGDEIMNCTVTNGTASLSDAPMCLEVLSCSSPDIGNGTFQPDVEHIGDGEVYTISCVDYFYLDGSENMTCTVTSGTDGTATLSDAPTCIQETCNVTYATIDNGAITYGEKTRYVYGDKVVFGCNDGYVMEGNMYIDCMGASWSSSAPTCTEINTNCTEFAVDNGRLGNYYPYFTEDEVRVSCDTDFVFAGENPRECRAIGWLNDAPTCTANDGTECISLTAPTSGSLTCVGDEDGKMVAGTTCTVTCDEGYTSLGTFNVTSCNEFYLWGHQSGTNSLAEFAPCIEMIAPAAKSLNNKVKILTQYCETEEEDDIIEEALRKLLNETLQIPCVVAESCLIEDVTCYYKNSTGKIRIKWSLTQTQDMIDTTLLKAAKVLIKASVKNNEFELSIDDSKRRKRSTTLSAEVDSLETEEEVTCSEDNQVEESGVCVECPAGYKTFNDSCIACPIGTYNAASGAIECNDCEGTNTTYGEGSIKADQCYELCEVPEIGYGSLSISAGFQVEPTYTLNLTCDETYEASASSFVCDTYSSDNHSCVALSFPGITVTGTSYPTSGESVTLDCSTAWYTTNRNYAITWTKTGSDGGSTTLENSADNHYFQSISSASTSHSGLYTCTGELDGTTVEASATIYVREASLTPEVEGPIDVNLSGGDTVILGYPVTLVCQYSGDAVNAIVWKKDGSEVTSTELYEFSSTVTSAFSSEARLTIRSVTDSSSGGLYRCESSYTEDGTAVSAELELAVLGATALSSDNMYALAGEAVTYSCSYIAIAGDDDPASWAASSSGVVDSTSTLSTNTIGSLDVADNGEVSCTVTYSNSLTNTLTITQHVRGTHLPNGAEITGVGEGEVTLTCVVYGDTLDGATVWSTSEGQLVEDEKYDMVDGIYDATSASTTAELTIKSLEEDADSVEYTCTSEYEHDTDTSDVGLDSTSATQSLQVLNQCVSSVITLDNGTYTGDSAPYDSGETVTFSCNTGYKLVGNEIITCVTRTWSRTAPFCTGINTNCTSYDVDNGESDGESSYITGESVSVECDYAYSLTGTDPRECGDSGWQSDAQTCTKTEGECLTLDNPVNGTLNCTGTSITDTCILTCATGYMSLDEYSEVECQDTLRWSHQDYSNSRGTFEPCVEVQEAASRSLEAEFDVPVDYCRTGEEVLSVIDAFETYLGDSANVPCLANGTCSIATSNCSNSDSTASKITFTLEQTDDMSDPSILTAASSYISDLVAAGSLAFEVTTSKKRSTTTFTAEQDTYGASIETECDDDLATVDDVCYECPAGYKTSPTCTACDTGEYNTEAAESCQSCGDGLTTYGTGSTSSAECLELCQVPGVSDGSYSPPTGYNVDPDTVVTLTCNVGYVASGETFVCDSGDSTSCSEDDGTEAVTDDGDSSTVIIIVVVVVVVILVAAGGALFYIKKKHARKSAVPEKKEAVPLQENTYDNISPPISDSISESLDGIKTPIAIPTRRESGLGVVKLAKLYGNMFAERKSFNVFEWEDSADGAPSSSAYTEDQI